MTDAEPRWLDRQALAKHISVRVDAISRLRRAGKLPEPSYMLGPRQPRWDREQIDALFQDKPAARPRMTLAEAMLAGPGGRKPQAR